jgi:hypothetical protein
VGERQLDDLADLRHRPERRRDPGQAATVRDSPRRARAASSGSAITASPIHWGATTSERVIAAAGRSGSSDRAQCDE